MCKMKKHITSSSITIFIVFWKKFITIMEWGGGGVNFFFWPIAPSADMTPTFMKLDSTEFKIHRTLL